MALADRERERERDTFLLMVTWCVRGLVLSGRVSGVSFFECARARAIRKTKAERTRFVSKRPTRSGTNRQLERERQKGIGLSRGLRFAINGIESTPPSASLLVVDARQNAPQKRRREVGALRGVRSGGGGGGGGKKGVKMGEEARGWRRGMGKRRS